MFNDAFRSQYKGVKQTLVCLDEGRTEGGTEGGREGRREGRREEERYRDRDR